MRNTVKVLMVPVLLMLGIQAGAQRFSVGTNAVDWLTFGTINAEASVAVAQHFSLHAGTELNPWTFRSGNPEKQLQVRQNSYWGGVRWWPWHVYSGWWAGADFRYSVYNAGGVIKRITEEGDAWGGYTQYRQYSCPVCGPVLEEGEKFFFLPDARIALQLIF